MRPASAAVRLLEVAPAYLRGARLDPRHERPAPRLAAVTPQQDGFVMRPAVHVRLRSAEEMLDELAPQPPRRQARVAAGYPRSAFLHGIGELDARDELDEIHVVYEDPKLRLTMRAHRLPYKAQAFHHAKDDSAAASGVPRGALRRLPPLRECRHSAKPTLIGALNGSRSLRARAHLASGLGAER